MNTQKDYDVLRLIEHNQVCYVSSDNVKGCSLAKWIKYHPYLAKKQIYQWIDDIIRQLVQIHKCRGINCYQYVNPYSVIVTREGKLCFLDIGARSNQEKIRLMRRKNIKNFFFPPGKVYEQRDAEEIDVYGLGKTIQYLLAFVEAEPAFSRKEEKKLQKVIAKCINSDSKKGFHKITDVQKALLKLQIA